ncbi:hypothetical protein [Aestuariivirga sp.]|uniref:hypothetical protein n=1 Tax=Aestuariivirga sp. TaxID=2650926 RepID=UPI00391B59D2
MQGDRAMRRAGQVLVFFLAVFGIFFSGSAGSAEVSRLSNRTLDVLVGFSNTGGGANFWRVFSDALKRHLPETTIRARFDDTLSGAQVTSDLFALPAGSLAVAFVRPPDVAFAQSHKREGVAYDLRKAQWIAGVEKEPFIMVARRSLPVEPNALRASAKQPILPVSDMLTTQATAGVLLNAVTGIPAKIVVGFKNSERLKAVLVGDADFYTAAVDAELVPLLKSGDVQSLYMIVGETFPPEVNPGRTLEAFLLPDVPPAVVDFIRAARGMGRAFMAAPSLPQEDVSALRAAFTATLADPAFLAEAKAMGVPVTMVEHSSAEEQVRRLLPDDPAIQAKIDNAYACGLAMSEGSQRACKF